ncbi:MAG: DUF3341 domain-containing protein [Deltaproteobacteria bacterium]|nr:DUF3341 domain-containing protein [Deltaproteobacteria bacterium]
MHETTSTSVDLKPKDGGLLAQFKNPTALAAACEKVRDAGYKKWDAHSPFPIHGLDPSVGIRPTRLPWLIFGAGITGTSVAILLQWWTNAVNYTFSISGKPFFSLPANIPIAFELTVLFAALTAFFATLGRNGLPRLHHPLFNSERFLRATSDGFFIAISSDDPGYRPDSTRALLEAAGAEAVEHMEDDSQINAKLPRPLTIVLVTAFVLGFIPLGVIARARTNTSPKPRIHVVPDMDSQPMFKAQAAFSGFSGFADQRAMRQPVAGTVAMGDRHLDEHLTQGIVDGAFATTLPSEIPMTRSTLERGRQRFNIYCAPCHGEAGYGDGMVAQRAQALGSPKWVPPTNLHEPRLRSQPFGQMFNTITHGIRNMPAYGHAIPAKDRWAIAAYLGALQLSQNAPLSAVPQEQRAALK